MAKNSRLTQVIDQFISPVLKDAGFRKRGETWNRDNGEVVHVIDAQVSRWSDRDETAFTLNVGLMVRLVEKILWGKEPSGEVPVSSCFPRYRIGYLPGADAGQDHWWKLQSDSDVDHVGAEVERVVVTKCLPLLDTCQSAADALALALADGSDQWKHPAERLALGVLMCLTGQEGDGQAMLEVLEADPKLKGWRPRIGDARSRLRDHIAGQS